MEQTAYTASWAYINRKRAGIKKIRGNHQKNMAQETEAIDLIEVSISFPSFEHKLLLPSSTTFLLQL